MTQSIRRGGRSIRRATRRAIAIATALAGSVALSLAHAQAPMPVPGALQPAGVTHVVASLKASGVQIYVCRRDAANQLAWTFQAPQADLYDASGQLVVRHGAGPSWEAPDGSRITGKLLQHAANPDDGAAPSQACVHEGEEGRSPYLAEYVFLE